MHFGCTSEDINNLAYARLLSAARVTLQEALQARIAELARSRSAMPSSPMLARTHGQPASPTTLGKEWPISSRG